MLKRLSIAVALLSLGVLIDAQGPRRVAVGDWPELRGPQRDGISKETGLPDKIALTPDSLVWRAPYGGRSTPIRAGKRIHAVTSRYTRPSAMAACRSP